MIGTDKYNYKVKYQIGDIVRILAVGWSYTHYDEAFKLLNIRREQIITRPKEDLLNVNWLVVNVMISKYRGEDRKIYALKNSQGKFLVIDERGIGEKRHLPQVKVCKCYLEKNKKIAVLKEY